MRLAWYWGREDGNHQKGRGNDVVGGYEGCGDYEHWGHTRSQAQFAAPRGADDPPPLTHSESRQLWGCGCLEKGGRTKVQTEYRDSEQCEENFTFM